MSGQGVAEEVCSKLDWGQGLCAQIHENFRVPSFLSVPASSDRLGAVRRRGRDAGKGSGG